MPVRGLLSADGTSDAPEGLGRCSFDFALQLAESGDSAAFPYPYPLIKLVADKMGDDRGNYVSVTSILHCLRAEYLKRTHDYYVTVEGVWPMIRGTMFHADMEKRAGPNAEVEKKSLRKHRGVEFGGTTDTLTILPHSENGKEYLFQDWKSVSVLPKYGVYSNHVEQINMYRWLRDVPADKCILEIWYFGSDGIKSFRLKEAYITRSGKWIASQIWDDATVEKILDRKLLTLKASLASRIPMPYDMVPDEIKSWECAYCPVRHICDEVADREHEAVWRKRAGLPPLDPSIVGNIAPEWESVSDAVLARISTVSIVGPNTSDTRMVEQKIST